MNDRLRPVGILQRETLSQLQPPDFLNTHEKSFIVPTITNLNVSLKNLFQQVVQWSSIPSYVVMDQGRIEGVVLASALSEKLGKLLGIPRILKLAEAGAVLTGVYGDEIQEPPICYRCEIDRSHCLYADKVKGRKGGEVFCPFCPNGSASAMKPEIPCQEE